MRNWSGLVLCGLPLFLLSACGKDVKAEFPRPPATATMPLPEEEKTEPAAPAEETSEVDEPLPEPSVEVPEPEPSSEPEPPKRQTPAPEPPKPEPSPKPPASGEIPRNGRVDPELMEKLHRGEELLSVTERRSLTARERQQVTAAGAFLSQAKRALAEGDERRAVILVDKGLILAADVEQSSRP